MLLNKICCSLFIITTFVTGCSVLSPERTVKGSNNNNAVTPSSQTGFINPRQLYADCTFGNKLESCNKGLEIMPSVQMNENTKNEVIWEMTEKACALKDYEKCSSIGHLLIMGEGLTTYAPVKQVEKGLNLLIEACNNGDGASCGTIASSLWGNEHSPNYNLGYSNYDKEVIGKLLGFNYNNDKQRINKMFDYSQKACNLDKLECWHLGLMYSLGVAPVNKDINKALTYYSYSDAKEREVEKTRDISASYSAGPLGQIYESKKDYKKAISYYERDCSISTKHGGAPELNSSCRKVNLLKNK